MAHSDVSHSLRQDDAIPQLVSGQSFQDRRKNDNSPDYEHERLSPRSSIPSMIHYFLTYLFIRKDPGAKTTSVDSNSASPSETTHLLEYHGLRESDPSLSIFWNEVKTLAKYAIPVFGTHVFEHSIFMSSVIAIGHISTIALAAATIGFMSANVTGLSIIQGMASALDTVLPSAWTSDKPQLVGLWTQRMTVLQLIVLVPIYVIWFSSEPLLLALRQDPEVARYAGVYLKFASLSLPAYSFNCISRRYFQAQGLFDVPARIIVLVAPVNMVLTYLLVWGPESMRLGFVGAPIATSISYNLISVLYVIYGIFFVERTAWHPFSSQCLTSLGPLVKLSVGSVGQVASEWWSWELVGLAASLLGPMTLATQSVLLTTVSCTFQAPFALGIAASVRIGNLLGEKDANRAGVASNAAQLLCLLLALFLSCLLLTFRATWGYMFNSDPVVVSLVAAVLPLVALVQIFDSCGAVLSGILRARGKQTLGALINISAYYCLGFPIGLWLTFQKNWGLFGLWWGLTIAMIWVVICDTYLCQSTDWQKEVDKVMARLAADKAYQQGQEDEECVHGN